VVQDYGKSMQVQWWQTRLNRTTGQYPTNAFLPELAANGIRIGTHFNDGPTVCTTPTTCHGYLQIYYAATNETFYYSATNAPAEPLGVHGRAPPTSHAKLEKAHAALLDVLSPLLSAAGVAPDQLPYPSQLVVGAWSRPGVIPHDHGYTAPTKVYWAESISGSAAGACGVPGLTDAEYRTSVLQPLGRGAPLYLANNDFVSQKVDYFYGDWAEESLLQAERALYRLGVPKPPWLNATYYDTNIVPLA